MKKGILKRDRSLGGSSHALHWDEDAIEKYDQERGKTMKITEPKTPYILYDSSNDELLGHTAAIEPIELTEAILNDTKATADQWDAQDTERPEPQTQLEPSKDMNTESHKSYMNEDNGDIDAAYSDRDVDEHKMFQEKRNSHYDMREAMERSRKLLAEENEDD